MSESCHRQMLIFTQTQQLLEKLPTSLASMAAHNDCRTETCAACFLMILPQERPMGAGAARSTLLKYSASQTPPRRA